MDCDPTLPAPVFSVPFQMAGNQYNVQGNLADLATLTGQEWINDQVMNGAWPCPLIVIPRRIRSFLTHNTSRQPHLAALIHSCS